MRIQQKSAKLSKQAEKYIKKLDKPTKIRLVEAIRKIPEGSIKPLENSNGYYRLKISDYRIIFRWENNEQIIVAKVGSRGDIYKGVQSWN